VPWRIGKISRVFATTDDRDRTKASEIVDAYRGRWQNGKPMPWQLAPIPLIAAGTWITWRARNRGEYRRVAVFQPATTSLTLLVAALGLLTPTAHPGFTAWILAGLCLSLTGDVFNIDMSRDDILYAALIAFAIAYSVYPIGIAVYDGFHAEDLAVAFALLVVYSALIAALWRHLESGWRVPVMIYALVMLFMVSRALGTFFGEFFGTTQAVLLSVGTSALFVADVEYSVHRFVRPLHTIVGPILYPGGQLAIALSTSYFPAPGTAG
jgi:uncharacterized membrane protein YhhN